MCAINPRYLQKWQGISVYMREKIECGQGGPLRGRNTTFAA